MATIPGTPNVGSARRLAPRPFTQVGRGKKARFVLDDGQAANVRSLNADQTEWLWDDGLVTDVAGNPIAGPVRNDAGEITGYIAADGKPVVKEAYDMLVGGEGAADLPDAVDASDPANLEIAVPELVTGPELDMSAPDDPNVAASAPDAPAVSPERAKQIARLRRDLYQIGGDLQNPEMDYPVSQDAINTLARDIGDLSSEEFGALSADPTLARRMELVVDRSNNAPAADASARPGPEDDARGAEFVAKESAPRAPVEGGAALAKRAAELGIDQKNLPEVLKSRVEDRNLATRASSETEKDPGSRGQAASEERLARDTPTTRLRKLIETAAGFTPGSRASRLKVPMDPAERVAAGELSGGSVGGVIGGDGPQGRPLIEGELQFEDIADETPESVAATIEDRRPELGQRIQGVGAQIDEVRRAAAEGRVSPETADSEIERFMAERRLLAMAWLRNDRELRRIVPDAVDAAASGVDATAMPDATDVVVEPDDLATFPSRRRDSGGRVPMSRREDAMRRIVSVPRRGKSGKMVGIAVPGMVGPDRMVDSPLQLALLAAHRAGLTEGGMPQSMLDELVGMYNQVFGEYAPIPGRVLADSPEIAGYLPKPQPGAMATVPDRSVERSLTPEQRAKFNELLVAARNAVSIEHPDFGTVSWSPEANAWEMDSPDFVVGPDGVAKQLPGRQPIDSEAVARQAADEVPESDGNRPVPTKAVGRRGRVARLVDTRNAAAAAADGVAGDTPTPPPGIPGDVDGSTPSAVPQFDDMEIDGEIERHYRDWFASNHPDGTAAFPDFDSWWEASGRETTQRPAERSAAAKRLGAPGIPDAADPIPAAPAAPAAGDAPATPAAAPAGDAPPDIPPVAGDTAGTPAVDAPPDIPPVAGDTPGSSGTRPRGPSRRSQLRDLLLEKKKRTTSARLATGLGATAVGLALLNRDAGPTLADMAQRAGGGFDPLGPSGGVPPGGMPPVGAGGDGFSDPLANDRAFQMARALQLIQAARIPQYQTANTPIGYQHRN
jgi:hypothetical protein